MTTSRLESKHNLGFFLSTTSLLPRWSMYHHYSNTNHHLESNPNINTHATLASQYLYSATSTHHLPLRPQDQHQRRLGFLKQAFWQSPIERMHRCSPALNGLGIYQPATQWNLNRQPRNGSPMQVDGRGDSLPFFPSFPSTNMSDCANHTAGESRHLVIESLA